MPTLDIARCFQFVDDDPRDEPGCHVITEARKGVSKGFCAAIRKDPADPLGMWLRSFLKPSRRSFVASTGRTALGYGPLAPGFYEAHSVLRSSEAQRVVLRVDAGRLEVVDPQCESDNVVAALNGMTPDALLRALRSRPAAPVSLAALVGTPQQVQWADTIRASLIERSRTAGDDKAEAMIHRVVDATWFIANRRKSPAELPEPAPHQLAKAPVGLLF
jgi:hypothetical protein